MSHIIFFNSTVNRGFPVSVEAEIAPAEPDVGLMEPYVSEIQITTRQGRPAPWLKLSEKDRARLEEEAIQILMEGSDYD